MSDDLLAAAIPAARAAYDEGWRILPSGEDDERGLPDEEVHMQMVVEAVLTVVADRIAEVPPTNQKWGWIAETQYRAAVLDLLRGGSS